MRKEHLFIDCLLFNFLHTLHMKCICILILLFYMNSRLNYIFKKTSQRKSIPFFLKNKYFCFNFKYKTFMKLPTYLKFF